MDVLLDFWKDYREFDSSHPGIRIIGGDRFCFAIVIDTLYKSYHMEDS